MKLENSVNNRGRLRYYTHYYLPQLYAPIYIGNEHVPDPQLMTDDVPVADMDDYEDKTPLPDVDAPTLRRTDTYPPPGFFQEDTLAGKLSALASDVLLCIQIRDECQQVLSTGRKQRAVSKTAKNLLYPLLLRHDVTGRYTPRPTGDPPDHMTDLTMYYELVMKAKDAATPDQLADMVMFGRKVFFYDDNKSVLRYLRAMKEILVYVAVPGKWKDHLQMGTGLMMECNRQSNERVNLKMMSPIDVDASHIDRVAFACIRDPMRLCLRKSSLIVHTWIGIQLATGCRMCEVVLPTVRFEVVSGLERLDTERYIKQIGRAKDPVGAYANAALIKELVGGVSASDVLAAIGLVRKHVADIIGAVPANKQAELINRRFNATAVCIVKRLFPSQANHCIQKKLGFGTHFLRAAWVNYLWDIHRSDTDCPTQTRFIAEHLGHDMSFLSAKNYECVRVRRTAGASGSPAPQVIVSERRRAVEAETRKRRASGLSTMAERWKGDVPVSTVEPPCEEEFSGPPAKCPRRD